MASQSPHVGQEECSILQIPQEVLTLQQQGQASALPPESVMVQQYGPFFQLPSEIRNRVYELVLLENDVVEVRKSYRTPNILNTCRQVRSEAGSLYYGSSTFLLRAERGSGHKFVHRSPSGLCVLWLATRAFQGSKQIQKVCLDLYSVTTTGWLEVWKPIALQIVRDQVSSMNLGDGIRVSAWVRIDC